MDIKNRKENFKNISLVGMPYCGKTTLGAKLAKHLHLDFFDLDEWVESISNKNIPTIFSLEGEEVFRKLEQRGLSEILKKKGILLSTGGGTPCFFDNMEQLKQKSLVVFLDREIDILLSRLKKAPNNDRPLISAENDLMNIYNHRVGVYSEAHITIRLSNQDILTEVDIIREKLSLFFNKIDEQLDEHFTV